MIKIGRFVIKKLLSLNFFLDAKTLREQDTKKIRDQVLATRLYLLIFIIIITLLVLFNSLIIKTISVTELKPSLDTYDRIYAAYPNTLACTCKAISIPHSTFISIQNVQHPVRFVTQLRTFFNHIYENLINESFFNLLVGFYCSFCRFEWEFT